MDGALEDGVPILREGKRSTWPLHLDPMKPVVLDVVSLQQKQLATHSLAFEVAMMLLD
jgi:hypothetical protein